MPIDPLLRADPADRLLDRLVQQAAESLDVAGMLIGLVDGSRQRIKSAVGVPEPWATRRERPLTAMPCRFVVAAGTPLTVKDARVHPALRTNAAIRELGVVAYAGFPLLASDEQAVGTLCAWDRRPRVWAEHEIRALRDTAGVVELEFMHRLALLGQTAGAPHRVPALETDPDGAMALDADWRITEANPAAAEFFRMPAERLIGRPLPDALPELAGTALFRQLERAAAEQAIRTFDAFCPRPHGWLEIRAYPTRSGLIAYFADIAPRKYEEREDADRACRGPLCAEVRATAEHAASLDELLQRSVEHIARHLDAAYVRAWTMDPAGDTLEPRAAAGPAVPDAAGPAGSPPERLKVGMLALQRRAHRTNDVLDDPHLGQPEWSLREGIAGFVGCPVLVDRRTIGALAVFTRHPATRELVDTLRAVAEILAPAIDRRRAEAHARQLTRGHAPADAAEGEARDFRFLAEASEVLDASLDYETTLANIARLVVPRLGDVCFIDIVDEDGTIRRIEAAHADPKQHEVMRRLRPYTPRIDTAHGVGKALQTGEAEIITEISDAFLEAIARDVRHLELLRRIEPRSAMVVPLVAREHIIGAITLVLATADRRYGPADFALARDLARRAALAADNARLYLRARSAQDQAEAAVRWRDQVLAIVSHDLKNPLSLVFTAADLLAHQLAENAPAAKQIETIRRSAEQMNRLIDDLLDAATIETGRLSLAPREEDAAGIVLEAYELFRLRAEEHGLRLEHEIDSAVGAVRADRRRVLQAIANIIGNAFEFTPAGGRITLRVAAHADEVLFSVRDTGRGIAPQHLPYLFDRFWRAEPAGRRGAGLGLTITRGIIEAHGGRIWAESPPGGGSAFYFTLLAVR